MSRKPLTQEVFNNAVKALDRHTEEGETYQTPELAASYTTDAGPMYGNVLVLANDSGPIATFSMAPGGRLSWSPGAIEFIADDDGISGALRWTARASWVAGADCGDPHRTPEVLPTSSSSSRVAVTNVHGQNT
jgi:hypothetical protein